MKPVIIDTSRRSLTDKHTQPSREYPWNTLNKVKICRAAPALFDELSIVFDTPDGQVYVTEVDPAFIALVKALALEEQLPKDWYVQAEAGHCFTITLSNRCD